VFQRRDLFLWLGPIDVFVINYHRSPKASNIYRDQFSTLNLVETENRIDKWSIKLIEFKTKKTKNTNKKHLCQYELEECDERGYSFYQNTQHKTMDLWLTLTSISHLLVVFRNNPFDEKHVDHAPPQTSFYITGPNEIIR